MLAVWVFMWVFMLAMDLLIPATMIGFGRMMEKNPSGVVDSSFGYRTKRSMKNKETWDFAQTYCGKLWQKMGWVLIPLAVLGQALTLLCPDVESMCLWSLAVASAETVVMTVIYFPVERALKQNFDENGRRR